MNPACKRRWRRCCVPTFNHYHIGTFCCNSFSFFPMCRCTAKMQNGVMLLWNVDQIPFTSQATKTPIALIMKSVWIMLSNAAGTIGAVLSVLTKRHNNRRAKSKPFTTQAITIRCHRRSSESSRTDSVE